MTTDTPTTHGPGDPVELAAAWRARDLLLDTATALDAADLPHLAQEARGLAAAVDRCTPTETTPPRAPLSDDERALLDFVGGFTNLAEASTGAALHARYGSTTRAWQRVNALLAHPEAIAYAPDTVARLRRHRDGRVRR